MRLQYLCEKLASKLLGKTGIIVKNIAYKEVRLGDIRLISGKRYLIIRERIDNCGLSIFDVEYLESGRYYYGWNAKQMMFDKLESRMHNNG